MITAQDQLNSVISDSDKKFLHQRGDIFDKQINAVVYGLYGLIDYKVKILEGEKRNEAWSENDKRINSNY